MFNWIRRLLSGLPEHEYRCEQAAVRVRDVIEFSLMAYYRRNVFVVSVDSVGRGSGLISLDVSINGCGVVSRETMVAGVNYGDYNTAFFNLACAGRNLAKQHIVAFMKSRLRVA